jgi:hypothetical protein
LIFYIGFKYLNIKLFGLENIQKMRDLNEQIDKKENEESISRVRQIQQYLEKNSKEFTHQ